MPESFESYRPQNAQEVRVTALMNVLYYARAENLEGLLLWSRILVRAGELSDDSPEEVEEVISEIVAVSDTEALPDRQRLEEAFEAACRMLGLEPA